MKQLLEFTLNGEATKLYIFAGQTLLDVIRNDLHMHGTKQGCGEGECGACTLIMDGKAVTACLVSAMKAQGSSIETIEGLGTPDNLHPIQKSFIECGAIQCGYCIPGMVLSAKALLDENLNPTPKQVKTAISGNICRCTGYVKIETAILKSAEIMRKEALK